MTDPIHDALRAVVGPSHVLVDGDQRAGFETDWTGRYVGRSTAVVRPGSTDEVAAVLAHCNDAGIVVVPQAGNSGLVGGGVPRPDGWHQETGDARPAIVLSLTRLDEVGPVDASSMQVTTGAGVTLAEWRRRALAAGFDTPVDLASRDVATVGCAIATNAGGSRVPRFGTMRAQVVGIEAVLASGETIGSLVGLPKETAGFHWPSVLAGSEGTLAVVTAARLRLVPRFAHTVTAMVALASVADAVAMVGILRRQVPALDSLEFVEPAAMELVAAFLGRRPPVETPDGGMFVVVECAGQADPTDELHRALQGAAIVDSAVTADAGQRPAIVDFRDRLTESIAAASTDLGVPTFKLDVAVPLAALSGIIDTARSAAARDGALLIPFGHLAEGNVHLNFLGATETERIAQTVLEAVAAAGGTISAEHGIGIAKARWLGLIRSPADLAAQRALKLALDPNDVLNPGVLGR
ncbi:MAG: FAD-binding oxidoreductase [Ilumatobacteraceae bacterium]